MMCNTGRLYIVNHQGFVKNQRAYWSLYKTGNVYVVEKAVNPE